MNVFQERELQKQRAESVQSEVPLEEVLREDVERSVYSDVVRMVAKEIATSLMVTMYKETQNRERAFAAMQKKWGRRLSQRFWMSRLQK